MDLLVERGSERSKHAESVVAQRVRVGVEIVPHRTQHVAEDDGSVFRTAVSLVRVDLAHLDDGL